MKQMLQFKKTRTWLPLFLAFLLTFLAVPFAASAEEAVTSYPEELLARFSTLDAADKMMGAHAAVNLTSAEKKNQNKSIVRGTEDKTALLVGNDASSVTGALILSTGIPFGKTASGTIEFYLKPGDALPDANYLYFGIESNDSGDAPTSRTAVGFAFRKDGKRICYLDGWNLRIAKDLENFWNTDENKDGGYTRFVMTYSNQTASIYLGDSATPLFSQGYSTMTWNSGYAEKLFLTVGVHGKLDGGNNTFNLSAVKGQAVGNLKDISIYSGALTPAQIDALYAEPTPAVRFEKADGTLIEKRELVDGSLTVESFPEITSDKTVCWFNKETGELVQAGAIFEKDTVLVAREFGRNETVLVGAQDGAPANNKVNARFVGGVYDLSGDQIGFDIEVTYKDADGQDVVEKYRKEGSAVYTSLIAAGESYTANQKGVMYLFALTFEEIPVMATEITFTVKPFKANGGVRLYGEAGSFTMVNGQFTDQPQA